VKMLLVI